MSFVLPYNLNELLLRVAKDDETAFRQLFNHYREPFYSAAFKMTRSGETAEEIVQEVFITIWHQRARIGAADNPVGYLMKILYNTIYTHFRKLAAEKKLKKNLADYNNLAVESPVDEILYEKENQHLVNTIIGRLPAQQQLVYRLNKQNGLSRDEIAAKLNISPNTVRNHLATATKFIREYARKNASLFIWAVILNCF